MIKGATHIQLVTLCLACPRCCFEDIHCSKQLSQRQQEPGPGALKRPNIEQQHILFSPSWAISHALIAWKPATKLMLLSIFSLVASVTQKHQQFSLVLRAAISCDTGGSTRGPRAFAMAGSWSVSEARCHQSRINADADPNPLFSIQFQWQPAVREPSS